MKKNKRTKEDPLILVHYLNSGRRRVCHWSENGKPKKEYYSRRLWRKVKGEIPNGYFIQYKDSDTMNDCIENYELVKRGKGVNKELKELCKFLKKHDKLDNVKKDKYLLRWYELDGNTAKEKLIYAMKQYNIFNFYQLYELTGIDFGQLSRIKNKNTGLGLKNIKRLFDYIDKINV